jgi:hypothetical protein
MSVEIDSKLCFVLMPTQVGVVGLRAGEIFGTKMIMNLHRFKVGK